MANRKRNNQQRLATAVAREVKAAVIDVLRRDQVNDPRKPLGNYPARMRVEQVAAYLNCNESHIRNLIDEGAILAVNIASAGAGRKSLRVLRDSVAEYEQKRRAA